MKDPFGDPETLIRLVYAYVAYRIGPGPDAEDITSATVERGLQYRARFDASKGSPAAWLVGIARRQISDHFAAAPLVAEPPEHASSSELDTDVAMRLDLRAAVARLGERDRELVALRYGADLTARQIGAIVGLQTNAVEVALHRALHALREILEQPPVGVKTD